MKKITLQNNNSITTEQLIEFEKITRELREIFRKQEERNKGREEIRRELEETPFDMRFNELCHATGYEALIDGCWWNEYIDTEGNFHYGNP